MTQTLRLAAVGIAAVAGLALSACSPANAAELTASAQPARLVVSGTHILDPNKHPIVLRGYNWGEWGTVQPQDAADNVKQGANSVRIPLRWWGDWKPGVDSRNVSAPGHIDPAHLKLLDQTIAEATAAHLWVDLFVDSNYGQGAQGRKDNFWTDKAMKQQFIEVWQFLVNRYRNNPYIGSWEILPEPQPVGVSDAGVKAWYDSMIPVIRALDPRTPIVVGPNLAYNLKHLTAAHTTVDKNIIYTGDYFIFDNPLDRISYITDFEKQFNAPVWINQVGIPSGKTDSQAKANSVLSTFNADGIGWSWWTYRVDATTPDTHGIWYRNPQNTNKWILKADWYALVGGYLKQ